MAPRDLVALLLVASLPALARAQQPSLFPAQYGDAYYARASTLVDLNDDGLADFVWSSTFNSPGFHVQLADGDGQFLAPLVFPSASEDNDLVAADFFGDGVLDIALARGGGLWMRRGLGGGLFGSETLLAPTNTVPMHVRAGDVDGDGDLDVVASNGIYAQVLDLTNGGAGFGALHVHVLDQPVRGLALADVDTDGRLDAIATQPDLGALAVLRGQAGGGLGSPVLFGLGGEPWSVATGDMDGDGALEVLTADNTLHPPSGDGAVFVCEGDGAGSLQVLSSTLVPGMSELADLETSDLDGDGRRDVLVISYDLHTGTPGHTRVLLGDGAGGLLPQAPLWLGGLLDHYCVGDIDGDCRPEVLFGSLRHSGPTGLVAGDEVFELPDASAQLEAADVDGDGREDLVALAPEPGLGLAFVIRRSDVTAKLGEPQVVDSGFSTTARFATGDVNGDGLSDLLPLSGTQGARALVAQGGGAFAPAPPVALPAGNKRLRSADLDGDGLDDLLVTAAGSLVGSLSLGDGSFAPAMSSLVQAGIGTQELAAGDLDGDGLADALTTAHQPPGSGSAWSLLGHGDSTFGAPSTALTSSKEFTDPVLADLDADGSLDMALIGDEHVLVWARGDGAGHFGPTATVAEGLGVSPTFFSLRARDVDADGVTDLVFCDIYGGLLLARGSPAGPQPPDDYLGGGDAVTVIDLQGDGRPDVIGDQDGTHALVLRNRLVAPGSWTNTGCAFVGNDGPQLSGFGSFSSNATGALRLTGAPAFAPTLLFGALGGAAVPFKGGTLKAWPPAVQLPLTTGGSGTSLLPYALPALPSGLQFVLQAAVADAAAPAHVSLSNALSGLSP